jgi:diguanylate cyclase (GGDEF)-like protein
MPRSPSRIPWPRRGLYPLLGTLAALLVSAGFLALRCAVSGEGVHIAGLMAEAREDRTLYGLLALYTAALATPFGFFLGRREDRLLARAATDPLTGLLNRRRFDEHLARELERSSRYGTPLTLLLLDLDRLKEINDRGGHAAGDASLRVVSRVLSGSCRVTDVVARLGGDEFAILAPSTRAVEAMRLAERVRDALGRAAPHEPPISVSIGVADLSRAPAPSAEALYAAADAALYRAKAGGRDRVALAPPAPRPEPAPLPYSDGR